jgi:hypothetical protein
MSALLAAITIATMAPSLGPGLRGGAEEGPLKGEQAASRLVPAVTMTARANVMGIAASPNAASVDGQSEESMNARGGGTGALHWTIETDVRCNAVEACATVDELSAYY